MFVWLTAAIKNLRFRRRYKHLESDSNIFDWEAYSMKAEDGRIREDVPNGAKMNIRVKRGKIYLTLLQSQDDRVWKGELIIQQDNFGVVGYKYQDKHEYGKRECIVGNYVENTTIFDFLFLTPLNDTIYFIERQADDRFKANYNYGREIVIRKRSSA